jgi:preprotein translocase subunit SecG
MNFTILILLLSISLGFFIAAYIFREGRRGGYMMLSGFLVILLAGILTIVNGLTYPIGYTIDEVGLQSVLTSVSAIENTLVSMPFILAGLWGVVTISITLYSTKDDEEKEKYDE